MPFRPSARPAAWRVVLACATAPFLVSGPARADNLDQELLFKARAVLDDLRAHGCKNVGVLKFRVQKGTRAPSFRAGPFNAALARRLENALVSVNDEKAPLGIVHDATAAAFAQNRKATYLTPSGLAALFDLSYPLAWGNESVAVDAFVTGLVVFPDHYRSATVVIQAYDRSGPSPREVLHFDVETDRSLLSDLGLNFALPRGSIQRGGRTETRTLEVQAAEAAADRDRTGATSDDLQVELQVYYDGRQVEVVPTPSSPGQLRVEEPREDQKVHFVLRNNGRERVAVELRVNGQNTLHDEEGRQVGGYTKWILEPGQSATVLGYYPQAGGVRPFAVLSDDQSEAYPLAQESDRGFIQLDVFHEGGDEDEPKTISLRGLSGKQTRPATLAAARRGIQKASPVRRSLRGVLAKGDEVNPAVIEVGAFQNPTHAGTLKIQYWRRK
jgi:hypothetical protein